MTPRELRLLIALLVILGGGGGTILVYSWFYKPYKESLVRIEKLKDEIQEKQEQLDTTLTERKVVLERARMMSLSPNLDTALSEYNKFLQPLLDISGLDVDFVRPTESQDTNKQAAVPGVTTVKPGHKTVAFQMRAKGDLKGVVKVLEAIQQTPLMHRVRALTIDRVDASSKNTTDKVTMSMTIEALMVNKAEAHVDGPLAPDHRLVAIESLLAMRRAPTGLALLPWIVGPTGPVARDQLAMESGYRRQYSDMWRKNIFRGGEPPADEPVEEPELVDTVEVIDYIRLDTTDPVNREAYLRNLVFRTRPIRLRAKAYSGYDTFLVENEWKTKTVLKGKVLRIDQRDVWFQVQEDVYGIHLGQSLREAMRRPLSEEEMELRDLTKLFDAEWGAREAKEAAKSVAKTKKGKGR
jgi:hypothetical protein